MFASFPLPASAGCCVLIDDFLTPAECIALIASSENSGYASAATDYPPLYRNNHRHVLDDPALAADLAARLAAHAPAGIAADGRDWHYDGVNDRLRFCRYAAGQRFSLHQDGVHHRGPDCRSHLTVLLYLSDGAGFAGGDTVFYAHGPGGEGDPPRELGRVRPRAGSLLLFDHTIWHAGEEVTQGVKHVLRSDIMYRASAGAAAVPGHLGYVWTLAGMDAGHMASGGRDATIRIWDEDGQLLRQLQGHAQSVLGLAALPGQRLASVSRDRTLCIWHWPSGLCTTAVTAHDTAVLDVLALPDGRLATSGADGLIKLWTADGSALGTLAGHAGWVWQLVALNDTTMASASEDGTVRAWDTASMRCTAVLHGDQPLRTLLAVDGAIWTGDLAGAIACWTPGPDGWIRSAQFSAHRAAVRRLRRVGAGMVASCGEDCALRVWASAGHALLRQAAHDNFVTDALLCGDTIVSSAYDGRILRHA